MAEFSSMVGVDSLVNRDSIEFINPPSDKYICTACPKLLWIPVKQLKCGHRLCSYCVVKIGNTIYEEPKLCPIEEPGCVYLTPENIYPDKAVDREIFNMSIYCVNRPKCEMTFKLRYLDNHIATECNFASLKCPNYDKGCMIRVFRKDLQRHIDLDCEYTLVQCVYCDTKIMRCQSYEHEAKCLDEETECLFLDEGCMYRAKRHLVKSHINDQEVQQRHLKLTKSALVKIRGQNNELKHQIKMLKQIYDENNIHIDGISDHIQELESNTTVTKHQNMKTIQSYSDKLRELKPHTQQTDMAREIKALSNRINAIQENQDIGSDGSDPVLEQQRISNERTISNHDMRIKQNEMRFRCLEAAGYEGMLIWKINRYRERKRAAMNGAVMSLYSQPFYSHRFGYKMCGRLYLGGDGIGKGTHASLYFTIMKGEYDNMLPWPFRQRVSLILMDQSAHRKSHISDTFRPDPTSSSFRQPVTDMNIATGSPKFVDQSVIDNPPYCVDDTVFIMIKIDTSDLNTMF